MRFYDPSRNSKEVIYDRYVNVMDTTRGRRNMGMVVFDIARA